MISEYAIELSDYIAVLGRRKKQIIAPALFFMVVSVAAAYLIPPTYKSTAIILIESPEIPSDLVETTVTGYVQERLKVMQSRVLTDEKLWEIANELDLYPEERSEETKYAIINELRGGLSVYPVSDSTSSPTGKSVLTTVALEVTFLADTPETAQVVADYIANLILEVNKKERAQQVVSVSAFLEEEAQRLSLEMADLEKKLAEFKRQEMDQLPEMMNLNLRQLEQAERESKETEEQIRALQDRQIELQAELALTSPYKERYTETGDRVLSADEKLTTLTVQFLALAGRYSPDHPDMVRMRREIETLANQSNVSSRLGPLVTELETTRAQLIEARRRYSDDHPDVKRLANRVGVLEGSVRTAARTPLSAGGSQYGAPPDNPQYVVLQTQLRTVKENLLEERAQLERLREEEEEYTRRLFLTPAVERDFLNMSRGYDSAQRKYAEIKDKQIQALLAERLEKQELAERFSILESASLSYTPEQPNRKAIILVGTMFGLMCGLGLATVREFFDGSVRGFRGIEAIFGAPPLAAVCFIETAEDIAARRKHNLSVSLAICAGLAVTILALHFLWMPVGDIWQTYSPWAEETEETEEQA